jgi:pimeloyl-ACP methyl ester carboxylesterase
MADQALRIAVPGATLKYVASGRGEPLVFVHGALSDHRFWQNQLPAFSRQYRCLAPDLRYFGDEPWSDNALNYNFATHVGDLAEFVSRVADGPAHIVGTSYGSTVALQVSLQHPELVQSLFLYEPSVGSLVTDPGLQAEIAEERKELTPVLEAKARGDVSESIGHFVAWLTGNLEVLDAFPEDFNRMVADNARTFAPHFSAPQFGLSRDEVRRLCPPLTLAHGTNTLRVCAIGTRLLNDLVPGSTLRAILGAHHVGPYRRPREFNAALNEHLLLHSTAA